MNALVSPGSALRRAALLLHAMAPADQAWLLARLTPARRDGLEVLLQELRSLGIPADASLLQSAAEAAAPAATPAPNPVQRLQLLSGDELAWLAGRLQDEPPELTAFLLAHHAWPWRAALLERLDEPRRQRVTAAAAEPHRPLPEAALCEALVRMLPAPIPAAPVSAAGRFWRRLRPMHSRGVAAA